MSVLTLNLIDVTSPYSQSRYCTRIDPDRHRQSILQTISINNRLNQEAQSSIDALEPSGIWIFAETDDFTPAKHKTGFLSKLIHHSANDQSPKKLVSDILEEEAARWPDSSTRQIVEIYQDKVGMTSKILDLRERHPIQYLHLLRGSSPFL